MASRREDADVRPLLDRRRPKVHPYTARRIRESYSEVPRLLGQFEDSDDRLVLDLGCGAGHHSFALATAFDRVIGVDVARRPIAEATRIARAAGLDRVTFERGDASSFPAPEPASAVWCNLMSHGTRSRVALAKSIRASLADGGWLFYSEEAEGYMPLEARHAIDTRDQTELRLRIRQLLNGLAGRSGFRFFAAGTAQQLFERLGFELHDTMEQRWRGMTATANVFMRAARAPEPVGHDQDYGEVTPGFQRVRESYQQLVVDYDEAELMRLASDAENRYAPLLVYLAMAREVLPRLAYEPTIGERLGRRLRRTPAPDWGRVESLQAEFERLVGE